MLDIVTNQIKNMKIQAPNIKTQINHNDLNSKFQTNALPKGFSIDITGSFGLHTIRFNWVVLLVIEYWKLRFICYLVLEIWSFTAF